MDHVSFDAIDEAVKVPKSVCQKCPVIEECFARGMEPQNLRWGIFGGLTAEERRYMAQKGNSK